MAFDPVTVGLEIGSKLIDRLWPDPEKRDLAKLELMKLAAQGELGQLEVNKVEAAHGNLFVAGWRPFIGWVCGAALVYHYIGRPLLSWASVTKGLPPLPPLDMGDLITVLLGMLGMSALRTTEKMKGVS
jgi:hypothetical protein